MTNPINPQHQLPGAETDPTNPEHNHGPECDHPVHSDPKWESICANLVTLANDLTAAGGWDQPDQMFYAKGDPNDPYFEPGLVMVHDSSTPHAFGPLWDAMQEAGDKVPDDAVAIVVCSEIWAPRTPEQILADKPDFIDGYMANAAQAGQPVSREQAEQVCLARMKMLLKITPPGHLPPEARTDMRMMVYVTKEAELFTAYVDRDGNLSTALTGLLKRGEHPKCETHGVVHRDDTSAVATGAFLMLHGVRPDAYHPNPWQAVDDHYALAEFEKEFLA